MNENSDSGLKFPARVMKAYRDYIAREQAWWEFLHGAGLVIESEAPWVLWGRGRH